MTHCHLLYSREIASCTWRRPWHESLAGTPHSRTFSSHSTCQINTDASPLSKKQYTSDEHHIAIAVHTQRYLSNVSELNCFELNGNEKKKNVKTHMYKHSIIKTKFKMASAKIAAKQ